MTTVRTAIESMIGRMIETFEMNLESMSGRFRASLSLSFCHNALTVPRNPDIIVNITVILLSNHCEKPPCQANITAKSTVKEALKGHILYSVWYLHCEASAGYSAGYSISHGGDSITWWGVLRRGRMVGAFQHSHSSHRNSQCFPLMIALLGLSHRNPQCFSGC
jgi:hypothetical protein